MVAELDIDSSTTGETAVSPCVVSGTNANFLDKRKPPDLPDTFHHLPNYPAKWCPAWKVKNNEVSNTKTW